VHVYVCVRVCVCVCVCVYQLGRMVAMHYTVLCQDRFDGAMAEATQRASADPLLFRASPQARTTPVPWRSHPKTRSLTVYRRGV
jgi:hypothetical protein